MLLYLTVAMATPPELSIGELKAEPSAEWSAEVGVPTLVVDTQFDTALLMDLRVVAGGVVFDWKHSSDAVGEASTPVPVTLPEFIVQHEDIVGFPLTVTGVLRTDAKNVPIPTLYGTLDDAGLFTPIEKPAAWPYRAALYPPRERHEAQIELDDNGDDTGTYGGEQ